MAALLLPAVAGTALVVSGRAGRPCARPARQRASPWPSRSLTAVLVVVGRGHPAGPGPAVGALARDALALRRRRHQRTAAGADRRPRGRGRAARAHVTRRTSAPARRSTAACCWSSSGRSPRSSPATRSCSSWRSRSSSCRCGCSSAGSATRRDPAARRDASGRFVLYTVLGSTLMLLGILALVTAAGTADLSALAAGRGAGLTRSDPGGRRGPAARRPGHQGAAVAGAHLAAAGAHDRAHRRLGAAGRGPAQDGHLRHRPPGRRAAAGRASPPCRPCWPSPASSGSSGEASPAWSRTTSSGWSPTPRWRTWASSPSAWPAARPTGLQAALFANVAHGVVSALLFFLVGGLKDRWGSADLRTARAALREVSPRLGFAMVVGFAATLGLPGLVGFWGEFLAMLAAWSPADGPAARAVPRSARCSRSLGTGLAAAYSLRVLRTVWAGERTEPGLVDARGGELAVLAVLVARRRRAGRPARAAAADHHRRRHRHHHPREREPVSSAVVSVDLGILLPVLAPAVGAAAVLVLDVVATRLRRTHYVLALVSLVVGVVATLPGLGAPCRATRARRCACRPARAAASTPPRPSPPALQLAALLGAVVTLLLAWPEDRETPPGAHQRHRQPGAHRDRRRDRRRRRPRPRHLAGRPRAGHAAGRGAGRAARGPRGHLRRRGAADHLAGLVRDAGHGGRALARRDRPAVLRHRGRAARPPPTPAAARSWCSPSCWPWPAWASSSRSCRSTRGRPRRTTAPPCRSRRSSPAPPRSRRSRRCSWSCRRSPRSGRPSSPRWPCWPSLSMTLGNVMALRQDGVRAPARVVDGRPGRLGDPAAGRGVHVRRPGVRRLPAGLRRRDPAGLHRGRRAGAAARPGRGPHPVAVRLRARAAARAPPAGVRPAAWRCCRWPGCRPACSASSPRWWRCARWSPTGCGCWRWSPPPTPCSGSRSTCAGCGCCSGRSRRGRGPAAGEARTGAR